MEFVGRKIKNAKNKVFPLIWTMIFIRFFIFFFGGGALFGHY